MCLLIFAHQVDRQLPLIVAANRDEFHARPTAASRFWPDHPQLLAGRDLELGGTWMGVTRGQSSAAGAVEGGRFAAVTNYRDPARTAPAPRSRGELPLGFLTGTERPAQYLAQLQQDADDYAGFNLLLGDCDELWYFANSTQAAERRPQRLEPGIYGLSNARLDTPWPKVELGKQRLVELLATGAPDHDKLASVVADPSLAEAGTLQRLGMGGEMDRLLSAQFIVTGSYGTRSTTTLWLDQQGRGSWRESSFDARGKLTGQQEHTLGDSYS
jgi:uncharacterized protein with NRDE domain